MRRTSRGLSLLEIIIVVAIGGVLMVVVGRLLSGFSKQFNAAAKTSQTKDSLRLLGGHLQKYMGSGDLRFFGFSGLNDRALARVLIPQFGVCGNLSTNSACAEDNAYLYVDYDKLTTPTVSVICALNPAQNPRLWLVDTKMETYGPSVLATDQRGFQVSAGTAGIFVAGKVVVNTNIPLALMNPPAASLWVATDRPRARQFSQNASGNFVGLPAGITSVDSECLKNFKVSSAGPPVRYDLSGVYQIRVAPLSLTQFTGGTTANITDAVLRNQLTGFPLRIFSADIRSIGKRLVGSSNRPIAAVTPCAISSGAVVCNQAPMLAVQDAKRIRVEQSFKIRLGASTSERFELIKTAASRSGACTAPRCEPLLLPDNAAIPTLVTASESFDALDSSQMSFLKQEAISKFGLRLDVNNREETYDVIFP